LSLFTYQASTHADPAGLISKPSPYNVTKTIDRLESVLIKKGITIVTRWSHSERADSVGIKLRPTELILFGNPKLGSHMFTSKQTSGIDLPLKALAWEDKNGKVWISYNDPAYIAQRHGINDQKKIVDKMTAALDKLTNAAIAK
jgi:uncharacterized protein (DUF302 family)